MDGSGQQEHDPTDKSDHDVYVDRDKIDFDPDDGLLSGTAIEGGTDIPGPHESVDDVVPEDEDGGSEESGDDEGSDHEGSDTEGTDDEES